MSERRQELLGTLERYYRGCGWSMEWAEDGTVRAAGPGGVTWIGLAVVPEDLTTEDFGARLLELSEQRMPESSGPAMRGPDTAGLRAPEGL